MMENYEKLLNIFTDVFGDDVDTSAITPESDLKEDLGMNSIGMLYMALAIEREFGVRLTNDDFAQIKTVSDVLLKL